MNSLDKFAHTNVKITMWFPYQSIDNYKKLKEYCLKRKIILDLYGDMEYGSIIELTIYDIYYYWKVKDYLMRHVEKYWWHD